MKRLWLLAGLLLCPILSYADSTVIFVWEPNAPKDMVTGYDLERTTGTDGPWFVVEKLCAKPDTLCSNKEPVDLSNPANLQLSHTLGWKYDSYRFRLRARNSTGASAPGEVVTLPLGAPASPRSFRIKLIIEVEK